MSTLLHCLVICLHRRATSFFLAFSLDNLGERHCNARKREILDLLLPDKVGVQGLGEVRGRRREQRYSGNNEIPSNCF